jgi:hypothetical protein
VSCAALSSRRARGLLQADPWSSPLGPRRKAGYVRPPLLRIFAAGKSVVAITENARRVLLNVRYALIATKSCIVAK